MEDKTCVFCQIAEGVEKSFVVYEDEHVISFLDKRPLFFGHCLLIPKKHIPTFYDLPSSLIKPFFSSAQKIGKAVEEAMTAEGSFIAMNNVISQSVPHFHIHIVPRNYKDGLKGFFWPRQQYSSEEHLREVQSKIKNLLPQ